MSEYERRAARLSGVLLAAALLLRLAVQGGWDARITRTVRAALSRPETAGFLFYLELGQALPVPALCSDGAGSTGSAAAREAAAEKERENEPPAAESPEYETAPPPQEADAEPDADGERETGPEAEKTSGAEPEGGGEAEPGGETAGAALTFTQADADGIEVEGACSYDVDKLALLQQPVSLNFKREGPTVLIVHTHTCEAYAQEAGWEYVEDDTSRTKDPAYSVVRVGDELAETLEARGVQVIHDASVNDYPSFNGAYAASLERIEGWLAQYPSIQMVIDVHRDAAAGADGLPISRTATVNGKDMAQLMLVVGTDEGGLSHPNWRGNLSWALKLQAVLNRSYPGLCRRIDLRTERFNQHATPGSLLVEVGASGNTLRQAIESARLLGEGLADLIEEFPQATP